MECIEGLPRSSLTMAEQKQLKESNILGEKNGFGHFGTNRI